MKYGETLRQRSIPAWSHHNIDYDDIKHFIKEHTTPGKGKTIAVPGRGDDKLLELENNLFLILVEQHERINLFVKSKAGEIQRRLDHSKKQLNQLALRRNTNFDSRIPVGRLERYGRLENDVVKAGDEIKSLARFTATQRTAFRKLLKKFKKWTGSADLEDRIREEVLEDPKSFTKLDLGPLLDEYSTTQQSIRALYDTQMKQSATPPPLFSAERAAAGSSTIGQLQEAIQSGSKVLFDSAIATIPLGQNGTFASYFVHPENIVELQMLLLQYTRFYLSRSRSNSIATPVSSDAHRNSFGAQGAETADYHLLAADNIDRFVQEQSSLTVNDRENRPGSCPQRARACVRWCNNEDALACLRSRSGRTKSAYLKRKHVHDFFDESAEFLAKQDAAQAQPPESVEELRRELLKEDMKPLFHYSACRSRLSGLEDVSEGVMLATLDTDIVIKKASSEGGEDAKQTFPFALLLVRQEGSPKSDLLSSLDQSHLVERIPGFSLEYHSVWQTHRPTNIPSPFWLPMLSQDIRKLPPMKQSGGMTARDSSGGLSAGSSGSVTAGTDSATAVERSQLDSPPLKPFRKKKTRRAYAEDTSSQQRYWSEYDHPEDGSDEGAYVIYIDPNEKGLLDHLFEKIQSLFRPRQDFEKEPLLPSPGTPVDDDVSSDDDEAGTATTNTSTGFGTFAQSSATASGLGSQRDPREALSHFSGTCFAAAMIILVVAYVLRTTGRHKYLREVHYGVFFSVICSLAFVITGFTSVLRRTRPLNPTAWTISIAVLLADAVGSGGLLASMFG